jgi:hypothetical protein
MPLSGPMEFSLKLCCHCLQIGNIFTSAFRASLTCFAIQQSCYAHWQVPLNRFALINVVHCLLAF